MMNRERNWIEKSMNVSLGAYSLFNKDTNSQPLCKIIASLVNSQLAKIR